MSIREVYQENPKNYIFSLCKSFANFIKKSFLLNGHGQGVRAVEIHREAGIGGGVFAGAAGERIQLEMVLLINAGDGGPPKPKAAGFIDRADALAQILPGPAPALGNEIADNHPKRNQGERKHNKKGWNVGWVHGLGFSWGVDRLIIQKFVTCLQT